jgi:hypothetical protein
MKTKLELPTLEDWDFLIEGEWTDNFLSFDLKHGDFIEFKDGMYYLDDNLRPKKVNIFDERKGTS